MLGFGVCGCSYCCVSLPTAFPGPAGFDDLSSEDSTACHAPVTRLSSGRHLEIRPSCSNVIRFPNLGHSPVFRVLTGFVPQPESFFPLTEEIAFYFKHFFFIVLESIYSLKGKHHRASYLQFTFSFLCLNIDKIIR